jgi:TPR repeat protein
MKKVAKAAGLIAALFMCGVAGAAACPWEDGMVAYNRGDYVPAIRLLRPLAEQGHPRAQSVIGVMYRRGQGVARSLPHAFMWLSLAAVRGDAKAKAELHEISQSMSAEELSQAREMMQVCEASNYRTCEY